MAENDTAGWRKTTSLDGGIVHWRLVSENWIRRGLLTTLRDAALHGLPVTVLVGPRACGKTTLARRLIDDGAYRRYLSFADADVRAAAAASPRAFIESLPTGTVIDEAQLVPEVLVRADQFAVIRARPSYDQMINRDSIAPWL